MKEFFKNVWEKNKMIIIAGLKTAGKELVLSFVIPPLEAFVKKTDNKYDDALVQGLKDFVTGLFSDPSLLAANSPKAKALLEQAEAETVLADQAEEAKV